jgi:hypothetical protein
MIEGHGFKSAIRIPKSSLLQGLDFVKRCFGYNDHAPEDRRWD